MNAPQDDEQQSVAMRARLGREVAARRKRMKLTQEELVGRGGPSAQTIRAIEAGIDAKYRPSTYSKLDRALEWHDGTAEKILQGTATREEIDAHMVRIEVHDSAVATDSVSAVMRSSPSDAELAEPWSRWGAIPIGRVVGQAETLIGMLANVKDPDTPRAVEARRLFREGLNLLFEEEKEWAARQER